MTIVAMASAGVSAQDGGAEMQPARPQQRLKFDWPPGHYPAIPANSRGIVEFRAIPGGEVANTASIDAAIDAVAREGGGWVSIPPGLWLTGPIKLKSNVGLRVERGALLKFSENLSDYETPGGYVRGLIRGEDLENIAIGGEGVIEGSGDVWRPVKKLKMTSRQWAGLLAKGGVLEPDGRIWWPSEEARRSNRPRLVRLDNCKRVLFAETTFRNSPSFGLDFGNCEDVTLNGVTVLNAWYSQNGDGIDLHSCRNFEIRNVHVDVGDDAICLKSGGAPPTENIRIVDCNVYHGHGGFVVGSEEIGGVRNVLVENCLLMGTDVGLRFKSGRDRGGLVENIEIRDVRMIDIAEQAILFDMYYQGGSPIDGNNRLSRPDETPTPVMETTPRFQNIYIHDIVCRGAKTAAQFQGLPEMPLRNITLENSTIEAGQGVIAIDAEGIALRKVGILNTKGPVLNLFNVKRMEATDLKHPASAETVLRLQGTANEGILVTPEPGADRIRLEDGASLAAMKNAPR
jgi:polygalacturonase